MTKYQPHNTARSHITARRSTRIPTKSCFPEFTDNLFNLWDALRRLLIPEGCTGILLFLKVFLESMPLTHH